MGIVGLFSTSLWACRISCGGYSGIACAAELTLLFFFSIKLNFKGKKMAVSSRAVDYWTDDAVLRCFSVLVRWLARCVEHSRKMILVEEPSFGGGENTRCRTCLDELRRTYSKTNSREELSDFCACTGPVGTGLGAVCVERGGQTWPKKYVGLHKHTHKNTQTEKVVQGALPSYAVRYEEEKKAQCCALRAQNSLRLVLRRLFLSFLPGCFLFMWPMPRAALYQQAVCETE